MREIKFRAWDNKSRCMIDWGCMNQTAFNNINILFEYEYLKKDYENKTDIERAILKALNHGDHVKQSFLYKIFNLPELELMQFTGLFDKNGKEIYEGDIITFKECNGGIKIKYVEYDSGGFYPFADEQDNAPYPKPNECEIIGNIHETPELLK